ncbi:MAG: PTS sugar transporter subunit IIA [Pacificimonas sp.]
MTEAAAFDPATLLCQNCIRVGLRVGSLRALCDAMAKPLAEATGHDEALIAEALLQRERVGSTAFGGGSAIPHARLSDLPRVVGAFAILETPLPMDALDGEPVDVVYALLSPDGAGADHLKALAAVSRLLRDRALVEKLRGAENGDAAHALLSAQGWSADG